MPTRAKRRKKKSAKSAWDWYLRVLIVLAAAVLLAFVWFLLQQRSAARTAHLDFGARLAELAAARGADGANVRADDPITKVDGVFVRTWRISTPNPTALNALLEDIVAEAERWDARIAGPPSITDASASLRLEMKDEAFQIVLTVGDRRRAASVPATAAPRPPTPTTRPQPPAHATGKLAILLDDAGQSSELLIAAAALPPAVGVAVLPFLPESQNVADEMYRAGHEVWLHLPMEPEGYPGGSDPGPGAVLVSMSEAQIRSAVHKAVNNVPHAVGVNNHMGSRATADLRTMTWVMQELKGRGLAFIDSRTTRDTVAEAAARAQGVHVGRRNVFLDNERTRSAIRKQLDEAVLRARTDGEAIAIGHLAKTTIEVLAREIPGLRKRGAILVPPSKLVR